MSGPPSASARPAGETAPAEADLAGIQADRDAPRSGQERISKPRRRRIRRSVVAVLVALSCLLVKLRITEPFASMKSSTTSWPALSSEYQTTAPLGGFAPRGCTGGALGAPPPPPPQLTRITSRGR